MKDLKDIVTSPHILRVGITGSRLVPMSIGDRLAWLAADIVTRFKPKIFEVVQANISQVLGPGAEGIALDQVVRQVFYTTLRSNYDLFRALRLPREKLLNLVELPEEARAVVRSLLNREGGSVVVFPHLGNFDLGGQVVAAFLPDPQVLTLPDPPPGFQLLNKLRRITDIEVTPLSSAALRTAVKRLRRGGIVSIAGDRPVSALDEPVSFFGSPARVPSGHVRLALRTDAVIVLAYCILGDDRKGYTMHFEEPMEMIRTGNREKDIQVNMRNVLDALEAIIRQWPEQWQMYVPVWPKLLES